MYSLSQYKLTALKTATCVSPSAFTHTMCLVISGYGPLSFSVMDCRNRERSSHLPPKAGKGEVIAVLEVGEFTRKRKWDNENSVSMQEFVLILLQEHDWLW